MNLARYAYYSIGCGREQGQFAKKGFPRGGSCQRPRPLTDEGKPCRGCQFMEQWRRLRPHPASGGASATFPRGGRQAHSKSQLISSASLPNSSRVRVLSAVNRASSSCTRGILCAGMPMRASSFFVNGGFFAVRPSRDTASGSMPQISFAFLHPSCGFLHYNRRRRKKPEKSQSMGGVYRTVKSFLCRQGRGASGTLDVLLCFGSLNLCLLPKNWSVRLQFQKKCLFCCRKIV